MRALVDALCALSLLVVTIHAAEAGQPDDTPPPAPTVERLDRPYEEEETPVEPRCMPSKYEVMQYWRLDVVRMRHLLGRSSDTCLRKTFGDTYTPVANAVRRGASSYNLPEPPASYTKAIRARAMLRPQCANGVCASR